MSRLKRWLCVVLMLVAVLTAACGDDDLGTAPVAAKPASPGVSFLDYSPKPYTKDMTEMTVRFTTTGPAGEGRYYQVWLWTGLGKSNGDNEFCYPEFSSSKIIRGSTSKRTHTVTLETVLHDGGHVCLGRAQLVVWLARLDDCCGGPVMQKLRFRVLPAR